MDIRASVLLLVFGAVLLIMGTLISGTVYGSINKQVEVVNESINITQGAVNYLQYTPVVEGSEAIYNSDKSVQLVRDQNYTIDYETGKVEITNVNNTAVGNDGLADYKYYTVKSAEARAAMEEVHTNVANGFKLAGIGLIIVAAGFIIKTLMAAF